MELVIVLIIIGISSALVVPRFIGGMGGVDLKTASGQVAASLRYARSQAVSQKVPYAAVFDLEKNRLTIMSQRTGETEDSDESSEEGSASAGGKRYDLPDGIVFMKVASEEESVDEDAEGFTIGFYPSGGSDGGAVAVTNQRGGRYIVVVDVITGSVRLTRGEDE